VLKTSTLFFCSKCKQHKRGQIGLDPQTINDTHGIICKDCALKMGMYCGEHGKIHTLAHWDNMSYCISCFQDMAPRHAMKAPDIFVHFLQIAKEKELYEELGLMGAKSYPYQLPEILCNRVCIFALYHDIEFDDAVDMLTDYDHFYGLICEYPYPIYEHKELTCATARVF